jgi:hypothetical protein
LSTVDPLPPDRGRRLSPVELRLRKIEAYYDVLNEDTNFADALARLAVALRPLFGPGILSLENHPEIGTFATEWRLPRDDHNFALDGHHHLDVSLAAVIEPPRLGTGFALVSAAFMPIPPLPTLPRYYNPTSAHEQVEMRGRIREIVDRSKELLANMDRWEKVAELTPIPTQHVDQEQLRKLARRLYLRAVCRWRYPQVARDANVDQETVVTTIRDWAKDVGSDLPKMRPGRPRNR